ncbi:MAG: 50S ribosomal protein L15 [Patescibacteria group bacterium]
MNESEQINLHSLPKIAARGKKRVGRGYGSGKGGHTSGRGQKGQRSRRTIPWSFEGGALPLSQRLPFWRGKGRLNPLSDNPVAINLNQLDKLPAGTIVDAGFLVKMGWVKTREIAVRGAKILGGGKLTKKLTIAGLKISVSAKAAVEKAGGKVEEIIKKAEKAEKAKKVETAEKKAVVEKKVIKKTIAKPKKIIVKIKKSAKKT